MLSDLPSIIADSPELALVAALVLRSILAWQSELSWYEYRTLHGVKRMVVARTPTDSVGPLSLVNRKGGREDGEFIVHLDQSPRAVVSTLRAEGFSLHLLASLKIAAGRPSAAQLVYQHDDGTQTEVSLFKTDGGTDVYAHHETSAGSIRHLTATNQQDGDPRGVLPWRRED